MSAGHRDDLRGVHVQGAEVEAVVKKVLVSPRDGWDGWVMRLFEIGGGGHTPRHAHAWPHINFVVEGSGSLYLDGDEVPLRAGSFAFVQAGSEHQFTNTGSGTFTVICIVPEAGDV